jgi:hypothetical protein
LDVAGDGTLKLNLIDDDQERDPELEIILSEIDRLDACDDDEFANGRDERMHVGYQSNASCSNNSNNSNSASRCVPFDSALPFLLKRRAGVPQSPVTQMATEPAEDNDTKSGIIDNTLEMNDSVALTMNEAPVSLVLASDLSVEDDPVDVQLGL